MSKHWCRSSAWFLLRFVALYYAIYAVLFMVQFRQPLYNTVQQGAMELPNHLSGSWSTFDQARKYDTIILGSSHAMHGIDTRVFWDAGYAAYNLGSPNQTLINALEAAKYLAPHTRSFIVEVYPAAAIGDGEYALRDFIATMDDPRLLLPMAARVNTLRGWQHLSLKPLVNFLWAGRPRKFTDSINGYYSIDEIAPADVRYETGAPLERRMIDRAIRMADRLMSECSKREAALAFVYVPVPHASKRHKNERSFLRALAAKCDEHHVPFWDLSDSNPLDDHRDFYDSNHLNSNGARWTATALVERMQAAAKLGGSWQALARGSLPPAPPSR